MDTINDNDLRRLFREGKMRISSRELATRLGITNEEMSALIEEHRDELEPFGAIVTTRQEEDDDEIPGGRR